MGVPRLIGPTQLFSQRKTALTDLQMFIPITKVDAAKRLVYGVATAEVKDRSGEICDYAGTKPLYEKWSGEIAKASDGKSLGNLRAMHGKVAAGKVTEINFNDDQKQIEICAKVVDDAEWNKVEEGVYTGFSQGGSYVKRWKDDEGLQRYIAEPIEVSLVDVPCLPTATFEMIKADGAVVQKAFATVAPKVPTNDEIAAKAKELAKAAGDETKWPDHIEAAGAELAKAVVVAPKVEAEKVSEPVEDPRSEVEQVWKSKDGQTFKLKADAVKHNEELAKVSSPAKPLDDATAALAAALGKADLSTDGRKEEAKEGVAMKDGSYPIDDKKSLGDAIESYGRAKNKAATKRHIIKRAKALKMTDMLPADWPGSTKKDDAAKAAGATVEKAISLYGVANLVQLLAAISDAEEGFEQDTYWDFGGAISASDDLKTRFGALLVEFGDIVAEALDAILSSTSDEESAEAMERYAPVLELMKAGARHSKTDKATLQAAHDALVKLGADCGMDKSAAPDLSKAADLTKVLADNADLKASMEKAIGMMADAGKTITELRTEVDMLKKQPLLGGPVQLQVVSKEDESVTAVRKAAETGDANAVAVELIKQSFGNPYRGLPGLETKRDVPAQ